VAKLGRNTNNSLNAGVTYWNLNNAATNDNINIGSQISLFYNFLRYNDLASWQNINKVSIKCW